MMRSLLTMAILLIAGTMQAAENKNNVVILLDTSGSMQEQMRTVHETKWNAAKTALSNVVDQIPEDTNVGLLLFNPEDWIYDLGPVNKDELKTAINNASITPQSGTPLGTYLKKAADRLLQARDKAFGYGTYKLLVVTDGDPTNEPQNLVDQYLPDIVSRGITVECIGVSMEEASVLKSKVHKYMSADDPSSLETQIQTTVLAEVSMDDSFEEDAFAELSGISEPIADTIINTLSTTGNHPIGTKPRRIIDQNTSSGDFSQVVNENQGSATLHTFFLTLLCVVLGIIFLAFIAAMLSS